MPEPPRIIEDVACPQCGCACDDLTITVRDNRVVGCEGACEIAAPWFASLNVPPRSAARIDGRPAALDEAADAAAAILSAARAPLVYGLAGGDLEGQRAAIRLADHIGATIDTPASRGRGGATVALQQVGQSACSLGEIRHRADLVIFWGANPVESHPRHLERYAVDPVGQFVPEGREGRYVVAVDGAPTATSARADCFLQIEPLSHFEALWTLRALVKGVEVEPAATPGPPLAALRDLAERMKACRTGVVFFGAGLTRQADAAQSIEVLLRFVAELNAHSRFYALEMRDPGADAVLCWQTGFPFGVNLSRGYPRYNPGEYTADALLERGEADACLIVGGESLDHLSPRALAKLRGLPTVALDPPSVARRFEPRVSFTTAVAGAHVPGTAYRMDGTPIPLRAFLDTDLPSVGEVLRAIQTRLPRRP
jgi:formylmethanofuran dehydrogenase subunit B